MIQERTRHTDLKGFFDFHDLYSYVAFEIGSNDAFLAKFVEVGVFHGKSLAYLAEQVQLAGREGDIQLYAVDMWHTDRFFNQFKANMYACGIAHMITPIRAPSTIASRSFQDESLDFVFVDAGHNYSDVISDISSWLPKMKLGSLFAGHDIHLEPVRKAVDDMLGLKNCQIWGKSWVYRVKPN